MKEMSVHPVGMFRRYAPWARPRIVRHCFHSVASHKFRSPSVELQAGSKRDTVKRGSVDSSKRDCSGGLQQRQRTIEVTIVLFGIINRIGIAYILDL